MAHPLLRPKLFGLFTIATCAIAIVAGIVYFGLASELEYRTWDQRLKLVASSQHHDPKIVIVSIDQSSLNNQSVNGNLWPWSRDMYEPVVRYMQEVGARGVAFDVLFTEHQDSRVETDQQFAELLTQSVPIVIAVAAVAEHAVGNTEFEKPEDLAIFRGRQSKFNSSRSIEQRYLAGSFVPRFTMATLPYTELLEKAPVFGSVIGTVDSDGIYRHIRPGAEIAQSFVLSLPFALFEVAAPQQLREQLNLERYFDDQQRLAVRFSGGRQTYTTISFDQIIQAFLQHQEGKETPELDQLFRDAYVFVGMDAPGLLDLRPTPLAEQFPGVEFHANVLDNLLHNKFVWKLPLWITLLLSAFGILVVSASCILVSQLRYQLLLLLFSFVGLVGGAVWLASHAVWLPLLGPFIGMLTAMIGAIGFEYKLEGRQHRFIKNAFQFYVSPAVIDRIVRDPTSLSLGGDRRELTIYFSDLAGFTSISERIDANRLVPLLNTYLTAMTDIILGSGGTLDKYEGDAIIAFWNAPLNLPDHATRAVRAAIACQAKLGEMREQLQREFGVSLFQRVGLNTGPVSVGNFGSRERFNYTVIGDAANLASRLEGTNKVFGTSILIAQSTFDALQGSIAARRVADLRVVGRKEPVAVYEPYNSELLTPERRAQLERFEQARRLFDQGELDQARVIFEQLEETDATAKVYRQRIDEVLKAGFDPAAWSSVWEMTSK